MLIFNTFLNADEKQIEKVRAQFPMIQKRLIMIYNKILPRNLATIEKAKIFSDARAETFGDDGVVIVYTLPDDYDLKDLNQLKKAKDFISNTRDEMENRNKDDPEMRLLLDADFKIAYRLEHKKKSLKQVFIRPKN